MSVLRQVDFFNPNKREMRSVNPNSVTLKRPTGWVVVVSGNSAAVAHMYVAVNDTGSWQRVDAGTGTLG